MKASLLVIILALVVALLTDGAQGQGSYSSDGFQQDPPTTPVPILRQINSLNEDGSYTYGYEGGDGSYKIETKSVSGEVKGKYGFVDPTGQLREIEYGATMSQGFIPTGTGIDPALSASFQPAHNHHQARQTPSGADDDGQYRPAEHEDPYAYVPEVQVREPPRGHGGQGGQEVQQPYYQHLQQREQFGSFPVSTQERPRRLRLSRRHHSRQHQYPQQIPNGYEGQVYEQRPEQQPIQQFDQNLFRGHPASNFDPNSGSYSISY